MKTNVEPQLHIPEILAPAGTEDAMRAAVNAGCDAVYLGGTLFSARAFAGNFDQEAIIRTLDYCHLFGVKVYMTVNTLLKENEIGMLAEYMQPFYEAGLDGVIVQDVGVIRVLAREYPDLPLHGSTQMSIASVYGAELLRSCGLRRVVPARELTLEEIRAIRDQVDIEIETFVHGAMCYAYSGKCLFSSFLGGRSGNRGRCAQPCRQLYEIGTTIARADGQSAFLNSTRGSSVKTGGKGKIREYVMSMKDMCTLPILPDLVEAGIDSFKIEGRMKNPFYVAATVDAYRQARDKYLELQREKSKADSSQEKAEQEAECFRDKSEQPENGTALQRKYQEFIRPLVDRMQDVYNRGGFCTGYYYPQEGRRYTGEKGLSMIARTRPNHTGLFVGSVEKVSGPDVRIRAVQEINRQDVLEIEGTGIELTAHAGTPAGNTLVLKGKELKKIKPGMCIYRTRNNLLLEEIDERILKPEKKIPAKALITAKSGEPLKITISSDDGKTEITIEGNPVEPASGKPVTAEALAEKMQKTGGTNVDLQVSCQIDDRVFIPMSELNRLRRDAIELFKQKITGRYHRTT